MQVWEQIQNMAWDACFVIVVVLLLRPLAGRVSRSLCYGMWIVVALRLMCPVMLSSPVSIFNYTTSYDTLRDQVQEYAAGNSGEQAAKNSGEQGVRLPAETAVSVEDTVLSGISGVPARGAADSVPAGNGTEGGALTGDNGTALAQASDRSVGDGAGLTESSGAVTEEGTAADDASGSAGAFTAVRERDEYSAFSRITGIVWIAGMALMLAYGVGNSFRMRRRLRFATRLRDNIYENEEFESPFVFGIAHPRIYLPYGLTEKQQEYIIRHEAFHVKRKDHLVKMLSYGLLSVYWFHPLVWVAYYVMARDMEMSCDAHVLRHAEASDRCFYSRLLLQFATDRKLRLPEPLAFGEHSAVGRVRQILRDKKPGLLTVTVTLILVAAAVIFCLTDPKGGNSQNLPGQAADGETGVRGMSREEFAQTLWESRNPYIGDAPKNTELLGLLLDYYGVEEGATTELQTSAEPYGITLHFSGEPEEAAMQDTAALFLALTENCEEFRWDHRDDSGELVSHRVRAEDIQERYQVEEIKSYAKSSDAVAELLGLLQENGGDAGSQESAVSAASNDGGQQGEEMAERRVISEQSFDVELNQWGKVRFLSCMPESYVPASRLTLGQTRFLSYAVQNDGDYEDVSFVLERDGEVVYRFPYLYENNNTSGADRLFNQVEAVSFRDVDQDGMQDVIVVINYVTGAGPEGMERRSEARIFLGDEEGFHIASELMAEVEENIAEQDMNIAEICRYIGSVDEGRVISEQSFQVELEPFGEAEFISYAPRKETEDVSFLLARDGEILYRFPGGNDAAARPFDRVEAVGFRDVNRDGLEDVIAIVDYVTGDQENASPASEVRIFLGDGEGFYADTELTARVAGHFAGNGLTIEAICQYIGDQREEGLLYEDTVSSEGAGRQLSRPEEG